MRNLSGFWGVGFVLLLSSQVLGQQFIAETDTISSDAHNIVTANGVKLDIIDDRGSYFHIGWGHGRDLRKLEHPFLKEGPGIRVVWENEDAVSVETSCGSACWYAFILPLDPSENVRYRKFPVAYSGEHSLVAFIGEGDTLVYVENISTGAVQALSIEEPCQSSFNGDCLESVYFVGDTLEVYWREPLVDQYTQRKLLVLNVAS